MSSGGLVHEAILKTGAIERITQKQVWWPFSIQQTLIGLVLPLFGLILILFMLKRRYQDHLSQKRLLQSANGNEDEDDGDEDEDDGDGDG